jgi:hypothetical protein
MITGGNVFETMMDRAGVPAMSAAPGEFSDEYNVSPEMQEKS